MILVQAQKLIKYTIYSLASLPQNQSEKISRIDDGWCVALRDDKLYIEIL